MKLSWLTNRFLLGFVLMPYFVSMVQAQNPTIKRHLNTNKYAFLMSNDTFSDYLFNEISTFSEGKAFISLGENYAYILQNGEIKTPFIFTQATNFKNGYAIVGDSFSLGLINSRFQLVIPAMYRQIFSPKLGLIIVQNKEGLWGATDTLGNEKLSLIYEEPPYIHSLEYIIVQQNGNYGVINDCQEIVYNLSFQYISKEGLAYRNGKYLKLF